MTTTRCCGIWISEVNVCSKQYFEQWWSFVVRVCFKRTPLVLIVCTFAAILRLCGVPRAARRHMQDIITSALEAILLCGVLEFMTPVRVDKIWGPCTVDPVFSAWLPDTLFRHQETWWRVVSQSRISWVSRCKYLRHHSSSNINNRSNTASYSAARLRNSMATRRSFFLLSIVALLLAGASNSVLAKPLHGRPKKAVAPVPADAPSPAEAPGTGLPPEAQPPIEPTPRVIGYPVDIPGPSSAPAGAPADAPSDAPAGAPADAPSDAPAGAPADARPPIEPRNYPPIVYNPSDAPAAPPRILPAPAPSTPANGSTSSQSSTPKGAVTVSPTLTSWGVAVCSVVVSAALVATHAF